jgi:hypothetical protein
MYYQLSDANVANILLIFKQADIKGADSPKVVSIQQSLSNRKNAPFFELNRDEHAFLTKTIDEVTIKAAFAPAIVALMLALGKGQEKLPKKQPTKSLKKSAKKKPTGPPKPK